MGSWLSLVLAAALSFAFGWLGYQLVQPRRPPETGVSNPVLEAQGPSAGRPAVKSPQADPWSQAPAAGGVGRLPAARGVGSSTVALACLAGGRGEIAAPADPSNYGPRLARDWQGTAVQNAPGLIVLHESVVDEATALNLFRRPHADDGQQASYHVLIGRDGRRLRLVPDGQRAFGAGDSAFEGLEVQLRPGLRPSVNNVALHVSLVSPPDGADGEARLHSGYTAEQYRSLASQIAQWQALFRIPGSRVVTHQEVDRSGSRRDPRSLDWQLLARDLRQQWLACGVAAPLADLRR